jgi:hypothetical protein
MERVGLHTCTCTHVLRVLYRGVAGMGTQSSGKGKLI